MTLPHLDLRTGRTAFDLPPLMPLEAFRVTRLPGTRIICWQGSTTAVQPREHVDLTCGPCSPNSTLGESYKSRDLKRG